MTPTTYTYRGYNITFDFGDGNTMINATEMSKPFGKAPYNFLRNSTTKQFIEALEARFANLRSDQIVRTINGGENYGTWMHEELALKFAGWLAPEFEVWVYHKIKELLTTGKTELPKKSELTSIEVLHQITGNMLEQQKKINEFDNRILLLEAKATTRPEDFFTIAGWCRLNNRKVTLHEAATFGRKAKKLSKDQGYQVQTVKDIRFGKVGAYHIDILNQIF